MLITNVALQMHRIMRHYCVQTDATFFLDFFMHPRSCHPTVCDQEIPQILSNHVVLFQLLAPPEPPQTRQQKRRSVIKTVLRINSTASGLTATRSEVEIKFYFLTLYVYFLNLWRCSFFMCLLLRSGNHCWELHGPLRQWLPVVPAGWDTAGEVQAE